MATGYRDLLAATGVRPGTNATARIPGSVSLTFGGAYGLIGEGPLTATIPLTTNVGGSFLGAGALVGASTVTVTPTGTLLALGVLTGTSTMSMTLTPTISGHIGFKSVFGQWFGGMGYPSPQALASTVPMTLDVAGGITGDGPLVSSIDLTFGVQGRQPPGFHSLLWGNGIAVGVDAGIMSGSVSFAFDSSGVFAASTGYFQNSAVTSSFTVSAVFETSIQKYQGRFRSPLMRPGEGPWNPALYKRRRNNVAATALGQISGTVPMNFAGFGAFSGSEGQLFGTVPASFTVVGTVDEAGLLRSTVPMLFTPVGILDGVGTLVGDVQISTGVSATITDPGALSGNASTTFDVAGVMEGAGSLFGTVDFTFGVASSFPNVWRPVNTGHGTQWRVIRTR